MFRAVNMRIVIVSDTHNTLNKMSIPNGDILIHCGDFCRAGTIEEVERFNDEICKLNHKYKIVVAGNHDVPFGNDGFLGQSLLSLDLIYLEDKAVEIEGIKFYGTPGQFLLRRLEKRTGPGILKRVAGLLKGSQNPGNDIWNWIPSNTDVLITHGPPYGILDQRAQGGHLGSEPLKLKLEEIQPKLHCFGHIHESYGHFQSATTLHVNAAVVDEAYQPVNTPLIVELNGQKAQLIDGKQ